MLNFENGRHLENFEMQNCTTLKVVTYHYVKFYVSIIIHLEVISKC